MEQSVIAKADFAPARDRRGVAPCRPTALVAYVRATRLAHLESRQITSQPASTSDLAAGTQQNRISSVCFSLAYVDRYVSACCQTYLWPSLVCFVSFFIGLPWSVSAFLVRGFLFLSGAPLRSPLVALVRAFWVRHSQSQFV